MVNQGGNLRVCIGLFPLTVIVTTRGNRSYNNPLIRPPLRTVTGWGNDPRYVVYGVVLGTYSLSLEGEGHLMRLLSGL